MSGDSSGGRGAGTGATMNILDRSSDCNKRNTTGRKLATKGDEYMEPIPDQTWPVLPEKAPGDGTRVMQYQWNDRESVGMTEMLMPRNYLEITGTQDTGRVLGIGRGGQEHYTGGQSIM